MNAPPIRWAWLALAVLASLFVLHPALAASLRVQPALVDVDAPGAAAALTLRNEGEAPVKVQIRAFAWVQSNGREWLEPTTEVVASPPAASLEPGEEYVVRIVRVAKRSVVAEESYRLLVDELPSLTDRKSGNVRLLLRQSIPVFFGPPQRLAPQLSWVVHIAEGRLTLASRNSGFSRERISALTVDDRHGTRLSLGKGLVGYVLVDSTMSWSVPVPPGFVAKGPVVVQASGMSGPIDVKVKVGR